MDQPQYNTLSEALAHVSDPRQARGEWYTWHFLLMSIVLAMASGQCSVHAIADWIVLHADEIRQQFELDDDAPLPSESTVRRSLRVLDTTQLETVIAALALPRTPKTAEDAPLSGQAIDGKQLRGVRAHGEPYHLVNVVQHADARITGQVAVAEKSNEITAVPSLLVGLDLSGTVTTVDALLTQRTIAQQILAQKGHYLMVVKSNQGELYHAIEFLFANPPWTKREQPHEYWKHQTTTKGHGRL